MQEFSFFKEAEVKQKLQEILFIWAKENPEFKYQQGMNEILAVVLICLASEIVSKEFMEEQGIDVSSDDTDESLIETC